MDIGRAFTFMFDDEKWVEKLAIGGLLVLLSVIPLVNIFTALVIAGYTLRLLKNVAEGNPTPLPAWDDWGGDWTKGLMVVLAGLIYSIPIILITGFTSIVSALSSNGSGDLEGFLGVCVAGLSCLSGLWGLAEGIVLPAAIIKYAEEGEFGSFFKFGEIFRFIGDNLGNYIIALLLIIVARFVATLGVILCVIGVFFTWFWAALVSGHLLGQVKAQAKPSAMAGPAVQPPAEGI
ncbi:MAG: DUF4013 domain-containing protein [Chloroflexi bacterium]|nr:DUF4013 domain-containing protein [Chloroflexota bacterium]